VPADSWFALGLGGVGATAKAAITQTAGHRPERYGPAGPPEPAQGVAGDIDFNRDLLSWMGDAALSCAARCSSSSTARSSCTRHRPGAQCRRSAAVRRLLRLIGQKPRTATIAGTNALTLETSLGPVWVVRPRRPASSSALGSAGVKAALSSRGRLGDTPAFRRAAGRLTQVKPSFYLDTRRTP